MTQLPMLGEIRMFSYSHHGFTNDLPKGWLPCDGQLLQIDKNQALYSLIGLTYGGDGQRTFALPDLRGRVPLNRHLPADVGEKGGEEFHTLTAGEMPVHNHPAYGLDGAANFAVPGTHLWANQSGKSPFSTKLNEPKTLENSSVAFEGAGIKHENMSPYMAVNFAICVEGATYGSRDGTVGELILYAGFYNEDQKRDWLACEGQEVPLVPNTALFSLLGTTYGGNGKSTFAVPDLRGIAPIHCGQGKDLSDRTLGERGGYENVTLTKDQIAEHVHRAEATNNPASTNEPGGNVWAAGGGDVRGGVPFYTSDGSPVEMNPGALSNAGGGKPHNNMPPYIHITYLICSQGAFPHRP